MPAPSRADTRRGFASGDAASTAPALVDAMHFAARPATRAQRRGVPGPCLLLPAGCVAPLPMAALPCCRSPAPAAT